MPEDIARELEALERGGNTDDDRRAIRIKRMEQRRRGADSDGSLGDRPPDDGDVKYHDSAESSVEGESNTIFHLSKVSFSWTLFTPWNFLKNRLFAFLAKT